MFCDQCGTEVIHKAVPKVPTMECPKCFFDVPVAECCEKCGSALPRPVVPPKIAVKPPPPTNTPKPPDTTSIVQVPKSLDPTKTVVPDNKVPPSETFAALIREEGKGGPPANMLGTVDFTKGGFDFSAVAKMMQPLEHLSTSGTAGAARTTETPKDATAPTSAIAATSTAAATSTTTAKGSAKQKTTVAQPPGAIMDAFLNIRNYRSRTSREKYWRFFAFAAVALVVLIPIEAAAASESSDSAFVTFMRFLIMVVAYPLFVASARRLHDVNLSARWLFLFLIPLVGQIALLVILAGAGTPGPNRFGAAVS